MESGYRVSIGATMPIFEYKTHSPVGAMAGYSLPTLIIHVCVPLFL